MRHTSPPAARQAARGSSGLPTTPKGAGTSTGGRATILCGGATGRPTPRTMPARPSDTFQTGERRANPAAPEAQATSMLSRTVAASRRRLHFLYDSSHGALCNLRWPCRGRMMMYGTVGLSAFCHGRPQSLHTTLGGPPAEDYKELFLDTCLNTSPSRARHMSGANALRQHAHRGPSSAPECRDSLASNAYREGDYG